MDFLACRAALKARLGGSRNDRISERVNQKKSESLTQNTSRVQTKPRASKVTDGIRFKEPALLHARMHPISFLRSNISK